MFGTRAFFQQILNGKPASRRSRVAKQARPVSVEFLEAKALLAGIDEIPQYDSQPDAPVTIYLDFDGHIENSQWNNGNTVTTPVFDIDGDATMFSDEELDRIRQIYLLVAEDFAPFNVNVTTEIVEPDFVAQNFESILVSIGGDGSWFGNAGGVAYLNSFSNSLSNTVYAFSDNQGNGNAKYTAMTVSHEVGHALGLQHHSAYAPDGTKTAEYHPGTAELGWIMGAPFDSIREIWYDGPANVSVDDLQDDLAVMTADRNRTFQYLDDDHGNTIADATETIPNEFDDADGFNVILPGVLERNGDIDVFELQTDSTLLRVEAKALDIRDEFAGFVVPGTNTDLILQVWDENGNVVATSNPTNSFDASLEVDVERGVYYAAVMSIDQYGALGNYTFRADVEPLPGIPVPIAPRGKIEIANPTFTWQIAGATDFYHIIVQNAQGNTVINRNDLTGTSWVSEVKLPEGDYTWSIQGRNTDGTTSPRSDTLDFEVDIPAPTKPVLITPGNQEILEDGSPEFRWEERDNVTHSTLWVNNSEGVRVIYRTNIETNVYTHFNDLPNGKYKAWVQSFNAVGERSTWSDVVEFTINTPASGIPEFLSPTGTTTDLRPVISWTNVGAAYYDLWVNNATLGQSQYIRERDVRATSYQPDFDLEQGTYVAWVKGYNADGESLGWSNRLQFTVDIPKPGRPVFTSPSPGETETDSTPLFAWTADNNAVQYDLWVNNRTLGQSQVIRQRELTENSYTPPANEYMLDGDIIAWVRGVNEAGEVGPWSSALTFELDAPAPSIPVITGPPTNAVGTTGPRSTISWTLEEFASRYELWVNSETTRKVIHITDLSGAEYTPDFDLADGERHTAWVRAFNAVGETRGWSQPYTWVVKVATPATPEVLAPNGTARDSSGNLTRTPTFEFTQAQDAKTYQGFIRNVTSNEQFRFDITDPRVNNDTQTIFYTLPDEQALEPGTYQFWVRGVNSVGGPGGWSKSVTFVISPLASLGDVPMALPAVIESQDVDPEAVIRPEGGDVPPDAVQQPEIMLASYEVPAEAALPNADDVSAEVELPAEESAPVEEVAALPIADVAQVMADMAYSDLLTQQIENVRDLGTETEQADSTGNEVSMSSAAVLLPLLFGRRKSNKKNRRDS